MYSYSILHSKKDVPIALTYSLENTEGKKSNRQEMREMEHHLL